MYILWLGGAYAMPKKNKATELMDKATDKSAKALNGVAHQDSGAVTQEFNAAIDKASKLASARNKNKQ
jgi:hypothetical protein